MLELRLFVIFCFFCVCNGTQAMTCSSEEFVHFLLKQHYLDGSRDISQKDRNFVINCTKEFSDEDIFSDVTLHSFVNNIAFIIAQTGDFNRAARILLQSYNEYPEDNNWLFEEIKRKEQNVTLETINNSLINAYRQ